MSNQQPEKLTVEEAAARYSFISEAIENNYILPTNLNFGVQKNMTVQDIENSEVRTLQSIGRGIVRVIGDWHPFFSEGDEPMVGQLPAAKWANHLMFTIKKKRYDAFILANKADISKLEKEMENFKTPREKKLQTQRKLAEKKAAIGQQ